MPHAQPRAGIPHGGAASTATTRAAYATGKCLGSRGRTLPRLSLPNPAPRKRGGRGNGSVPAGGCWRRRGHLGVELRRRGVGAATSGEWRSSRGVGRPQVRGSRTHVRVRVRAHTHICTHVRTYPAQGAGPLPVSASGVVPRVRARPPAGARARFAGQSARRGEFHPRAVRPALTLAIAAEGRGRRARKRRVSGGCWERVGVGVAAAAAGGGTTSTERGAGRAARRPALGESVLSRVRALSVALCVASPRRKARRTCAVPPPCAAPLVRDPGATSRPSGGTVSPPVAPGCVGEASWHAGFRDLEAGIVLGTSDGSGNWRGWSCFPPWLLGGPASLCPSWVGALRLLETCWPLIFAGKVHIPSGNIRKGGGQADFMVRSFGKREAERGRGPERVWQWHAWQRAGRCWCCPAPGLLPSSECFSRPCLKCFSCLCMQGVHRASDAGSSLLWNTAKSTLERKVGSSDP